MTDHEDLTEVSTRAALLRRRALLDQRNYDTSVAGHYSTNGTTAPPSRGTTRPTELRHLRRPAPLHQRNPTTADRVADEGRLIAWRPKGDLRWSYALEPVGDATRVTETSDITTMPVPAQWLLRLLGVPGRTSKSIDATLIRLKGAAEAVAGPVGSDPRSA